MAAAGEALTGLGLVVIITGAVVRGDLALVAVCILFGVQVLLTRYWRRRASL